MVLAAISVIACQSFFSMAAFGANQEPPTQATLGSAKYWSKSSMVRPPVGQKLTCGKGPLMDLRSGKPPTAVAGKSLKQVNPSSIPNKISEQVATPGSNATPQSRALRI